MQKGTKEKKKKIINKNFYWQKDWFHFDKEIRIIAFILCLVIYVLTKSDKGLLFVNKAVLDVINPFVLSFATVLLADFFLNCNYNKHLKKSLYEILTNNELLEKFVDTKYKYNLMKTSMLVTLGKDTTEALYESIIKSYNDIIIRNDYKFYVNIKNSNNDDYYDANIKIIFTIPPHKETLNMIIFASQNEEDIHNKMSGLEEKELQLFFPLLMAKSNENLKIIPSVRENSKPLVSMSANPTECNNYTIHPNVEEVNIEIVIDTVLNKSENFFQEDIFCIHNGYHLSLTFDKDLIRNCKCYHSCKAKDLSVTTNQNSIIIHTPGVLLPENNFVFIWEGEK